MPTETARVVVKVEREDLRPSRGRSFAFDLISDVGRLNGHRAELASEPGRDRGGRRHWEPGVEFQPERGPTVLKGGGQEALDSGRADLVRTVEQSEGAVAKTGLTSDCELTETRGSPVDPRWC